jgi:hypothetical protein
VVDCVVDGDVTGYAVTGSDRIRMRDRIWRHRNRKSWTGNRKWKGDNFPRFLPVFPAIFPELL